MSLNRWSEYEKLSIKSKFLVKSSISEEHFLVPSNNSMQYVDCANLLYISTSYSAFAEPDVGRSVLLYAPQPTVKFRVPRRIHSFGGISRDPVLYTVGDTTGITTWKEYREL